MALFTKDTIDRVRDAVDMVHLVCAEDRPAPGRHALDRAVPVPRRAHAVVLRNAEEKLYYCFGCGEGGDAFKFVQQTEALEFQEAVELLAERFNVRVEREEDDPQAEQRRRRSERLHALLDRAASFYAAYLRDSARGRARAGVPRLARAVRRGARRVPGGLLAERLGPDARGAGRTASARRS